MDRMHQREPKLIIEGGDGKYFSISRKEEPFFNNFWLLEKIMFESGKLSNYWIPEYHQKSHQLLPREICSHRFWTIFDYWEQCALPRAPDRRHRWQPKIINEGETEKRNRFLYFSGPRGVLNNITYRIYTQTQQSEYFSYQPRKNDPRYSIIEWMTPVAAQCSEMNQIQSWV